MELQTKVGVRQRRDQCSSSRKLSPLWHFLSVAPVL